MKSALIAVSPNVMAMVMAAHHAIEVVGVPRLGCIFVVALGRAP